MPLKDTGTDQLIKAAAKRLLFSEGKLHATTQDIADAAGMNRSALHYYYRTRDQLISQVFQESMTVLSLKLDQAMLSDHPFPKKVDELMDIYLTEMSEFPYEETFMVTEMNRAGHTLISKIKEGPVVSFLAEVAAEMEAGNIEKMNPVHFLINLFSLLSYPIIMSPLYQQFFQLSKNDFGKILAERKELVYRMLFKI
ncbi:TetR/AcrR family transcriptional regulator [Pedobacter sp. MC2016-15]|uniref:TetR/AcrR family transcriptional regulator n=1 Tax=Pedobacter sp. MC2016-15 TaxID=2994473 RepID=UPI0022453DD4|nr:TetR/AcrR family transcriptional regulator [Pedobacter sp. MC2016-15]MCX2480281.1 TetR/AcrR family transcriptional regulator [Pedobacter sp. MC2016-15]